MRPFLLGSSIGFSVIETTGFRGEEGLKGLELGLLNNLIGETTGLEVADCSGSFSVVVCFSYSVS